jgi:hypothetical protein
MYLLYTHLHFNSQKLKEPISVYNHDFKFVLKKLSKQLENLRFFHETRQFFKVVEIIVIDGCLTGETLKERELMVLSKFKEPPLRIRRFH